jgi:hypothetical protein
MRFGHNSNVTVAGEVIHVQTEDRGANHAIIDTTVYHRGRVFHRRTKSYSDLLPLDAGREQALKLRVEEQHATVIKELRSGALVLALPPPPAAAAPASPPSAAVPATQTSQAAQPQPAVAKTLSVELLNPRTWLSGKQATLYLVARHKESNTAAAAARVTARITGAADPTEISTTTGADGHAQLEFEMPRLVAEDAALVIEAVAGDAHGQLRFQLRAKPKVPAAG